MNLTPQYDPLLDDIRCTDDDSDGITYDPYLEEFRMKDENDGIVYDALLDETRASIDPTVAAVITGLVLSNITESTIDYAADVVCDIETLISVEISLNEDMTDPASVAHGTISGNTTINGQLTELTPGTTVYVRIKAINAGGTSYSAVTQGGLLNQNTMSVLKADNYIYLRTGYSETQDLVQKLFVGTADESFSPAYTTFIINKSALDTVVAYEAGTLIHIASDDAAPIFLTSSYIGAAHGLSAMRVVTANGHGKTVEDVGSEWIDGGGKKHYIIKIVDANTIWTLAENVHRDWYPRWYMQGYITGNLTHSAGATHTGGITVGSVAAGQLKPALKNKTLTVKKNGSIIAENGLYPCYNVVIEESYDIVNPSDSLLHIQQSVGSSTQPVINTGETLATIQTTFTYSDNGSCVVYNKFTPKQVMDFVYYGFTQSAPLYTSGLLSKLQQYIPKSLPIVLNSTPYDFRLIKDITVLPAAVNLTSEYWENALQPPERTVQYLANVSNERQVGFAMGYLKGKGIEVNRKDLVNKAFNMATTKKQYPYGIDSKITLTTNQVYEAYAFRSYFAANALPTGKVSENLIKNGTETYLYLDYNAAVEDSVAIPVKYRNKTITILDKSDNVTIEDTVTGATLAVTVTTADVMYGYAILKLT